MLKVYLAGPINGCTDEECKAWRAEARRLLEPMCSVIDPMDFDCRDLEGEMACDIISYDLRRLEEVDIVLVNAKRPSWGTAMEMACARRGQKPVFAFVGSSQQPVSHWLRGYSTKVCSTLAQACFDIVNFYPADDATSTREGRT